MRSFKTVCAVWLLCLFGAAWLLMLGCEKVENKALHSLRIKDGKLLLKDGKLAVGSGDCGCCEDCSCKYSIGAIIEEGGPISIDHNLYGAKDGEAASWESNVDAGGLHWSGAGSEGVSGVDFTSDHTFRFWYNQPTNDVAEYDPAYRYIVVSNTGTSIIVVNGTNVFPGNDITISEIEDAGYNNGDQSGYGGGTSVEVECGPCPCPATRQVTWFGLGGDLAQFNGTHTLALDAENSNSTVCRYKLIYEDLAELPCAVDPMATYNAELGLAVMIADGDWSASIQLLAPSTTSSYADRFFGGGGYANWSICPEGGGFPFGSSHYEEFATLPGPAAPVEFRGGGAGNFRGGDEEINFRN